MDETSAPAIPVAAQIGPAVSDLVAEAVPASLPPVSAGASLGALQDAAPVEPTHDEEAPTLESADFDLNVWATKTVAFAEREIAREIATELHAAETRKAAEAAHAAVAARYEADLETLSPDALAAVNDPSLPSLAPATVSAVLASDHPGLLTAAIAQDPVAARALANFAEYPPSFS
jgi:hypothetical protein